MINQKRRLMLWAVLFCTFLNVGRTLEAAEKNETLKKKMVVVLRQIPEVYQLDGRLNEGNFRDAFQLLGADLSRRVQEYQDEAMARRLSRDEKGKEEVAGAGEVSGVTDRIIMSGALNLTHLFLLDALRGMKPKSNLINQERKLENFYLGMMSSAGSDVFKSVFENPESRFYMKSSFWNTNFVSDYDLLMSKIETQFNIDNNLRVTLGNNSVTYLYSKSQYWNAENWGSGQSSGLKFSYYSQPDGFAQRHIIFQTSVQPVTHQGRGDLATSNCGLHALINANLFLKKAKDKDFIQNHDEQINEMRARVADLYKDPDLGFKETDIERALTGNLDSTDLFNAAGDLGIEMQSNIIMISIPEQIKQIAQNTMDSIEKDWKDLFNKKMIEFYNGGVGARIVFVYNTSEYAVQEDLRRRLANVTKDTENEVEKDLFNVFNQQDKAGHWITVMFEKTGKINTSDGVNRYWIKTTLADSLAGSHYKDATFLQLFFLQQLKKYEDAESRSGSSSSGSSSSSSVQLPLWGADLSYDDKQDLFFNVTGMRNHNIRPEEKLSEIQKKYPQFNFDAYVIHFKSDQDSPLITAAKYQCVKAVQFILDRVNPETKKIILVQKGRGEKTAYDWAVEYKNGEIQKLLKP